MGMVLHTYKITCWSACLLNQKDLFGGLLASSCHLSQLLLLFASHHPCRESNADRRNLLDRLDQESVWHVLRRWCKWRLLHLVFGWPSRLHLGQLVFRVVRGREATSVGPWWFSGVWTFHVPDPLLRLLRDQSRVQHPQNTSRGWEAAHGSSGKQMYI